MDNKENEWQKLQARHKAVANHWIKISEKKLAIRMKQAEINKVYGVNQWKYKQLQGELKLLKEDLEILEKQL